MRKKYKKLVFLENKVRIKDEENAALGKKV